MPAVAEEDYDKESIVRSGCFAASLCRLHDKLSCRNVVQSPSSWQAVRLGQCDGQYSYIKPCNIG
jgi:hypothetical protein